MALAKFMTIRQPHSFLGACGLVWSMLVALGAIDPGSNPGRPTIIKLRFQSAKIIMNQVMV